MAGTTTYTCRCGEPFTEVDAINAHIETCAQHDPTHPDHIPEEIEAELHYWNAAVEMANRPPQPELDPSGA
jgi:hypothetical protein